MYFLEDNDFRFWGRRRNGADSIDGEHHEPKCRSGEKVRRLTEFAAPNLNAAAAGYTEPVRSFAHSRTIGCTTSMADALAPVMFSLRRPNTVMLPHIASPCVFSRRV
jgi:hypothetical protein